MNINEEIKRAIQDTTSVNNFCNALKELSNPYNLKCPAAQLLFSIRHHGIISENVNDLNILERPDGSFELINSEDELSVFTLIGTNAYNVHTLYFNDQ